MFASMTETRGILDHGHRRLRRWAKHTPNGEIALTLITVGAVLLAAAVVLALRLH